LKTVKRLWIRRSDREVDEGSRLTSRMGRNHDRTTLQARCRAACRRNVRGLRRKRGQNPTKRTSCRSRWMQKPLGATSRVRRTRLEPEIYDGAACEQPRPPPPRAARRTALAQGPQRSEASDLRCAQTHPTGSCRQLGEDPPSRSAGDLLRSDAEHQRVGFVHRRVEVRRGHAVDGAPKNYLILDVTLDTSQGSWWIHTPMGSGFRST
jgi:hypothetical protein